MSQVGKSPLEHATEASEVNARIHFRVLTTVENPASRDG